MSRPMRRGSSSLRADQVCTRTAQGPRLRGELVAQREAVHRQPACLAVSSWIVPPTQGETMSASANGFAIA